MKRRPWVMIWIRDTAKLAGDVVLSKDEVEKIQDLVMQFDGKTIEKTVILSIIGQAKGKSQ